MPDHVPAFGWKLCFLSHIVVNKDDRQKSEALLCAQTAPANHEAAYTSPLLVWTLHKPF